MGTWGLQWRKWKAHQQGNRAGALGDDMQGKLNLECVYQAAWHPEAVEQSREEGVVDIEYELGNDDLLALMRFQVERSPAVRQRAWRLRVGYLVGSVLMGLGLYLLVANMLLAVFFVSFGLVSFVAYPLIHRWRIQRHLPQLLRERAHRTTFAKRTLRATPEGLEQVMEGAESIVGWTFVDDVVEQPGYAFLALDGVYSVVIPRARVGEEQFTSFLETLRRYRDAARASSHRENAPGR